jgi:hypothetical protein
MPSPSKPGFGALVHSIMDEKFAKDFYKVALFYCQAIFSRK